MARTGRPFANLDPPQINTKMCDKRALLSTAQLKGYATGRRWVRLKGVTVTRSYANTDEHWQSMSFNGDQCQSVGSIANDRTEHYIDGEAEWRYQMAGTGGIAVAAGDAVGDCQRNNCARNRGGGIAKGGRIEPQRDGA